MWLEIAGYRTSPSFLNFAKNRFVLARIGQNDYQIYVFYRFPWAFLS